MAKPLERQTGCSVDYYERLNRALRYAEIHMKDNLTILDLAGQACLSPYHFHRVFHAMTGMPPGEYLRRRKLAAAAMVIRGTKDRILDIAVDFRFESQEAFTRSFRKEFGMPPGQYRKIGCKDSGLEPLILYPVQKGGISMDIRFEKREEFIVAGKSIITTLDENKTTRSIPAFWQKFNASGDCMKISNRKKPNELLGICTDFDGTSFRYMIGSEVTSTGQQDNGFELYTIPEALYAIMTVKGKVPEALWQAMEEFYGHWLPQSGYKRLEKPDFELYDERFHDNETSIMEVFIPVEKA